jgi:hypothetical protein
MGMRDLERAVGTIQEMEKRFFKAGSRYIGDSKTIINGVSKLSAFEVSELIEAAIAVGKRLRELDREKTRLEEQVARLTGTGSSKMIDISEIASKCYHIKSVWPSKTSKWAGLLIPESQRDAFLTALDAETHETYAKGYAQGSNALVRLAAGDMSMLDFEEQARRIEEAKKPRGEYE